MNNTTLVRIRECLRVLDRKRKVQDRNAWNTPRELFQQLHNIFSFSVDGAANIRNALLPRFWSIEENALWQNWAHETVFLNPPWEHRKIEGFLVKAKTAKLAVAVVPTDSLTTRYFARCRPDWLAFPQDRVHFQPTGGTRSYKHAPKGSAFLIYGKPTVQQIAALENLGMACYRSRTGESISTRPPATPTRPQRGPSAV